MKRRTFLQSSVVGTAGIALAGCLGSSGDDIQISSIEIVNSEVETHSVDITVQFDDDTVAEESFTLDSDESEIIDDDLPDDPGEYEIDVDVDDDDIESLNTIPTEATDDECVEVEFQIRAGSVLQEFEGIEC